MRRPCRLLVVPKGAEEANFSTSLDKSDMNLVLSFSWKKHHADTQRTDPHGLGLDDYEKSLFKDKTGL